MSELIKHFGIDWKLLVAQAVNFIILFLILRRFAYRPILQVLRKRRERIAQGLEFTKTAEERLAEVEQLGEEKLGEARKEALKIVGEAEHIGRARKDELLKEAAYKGGVMIDEAKRAIREEKAKITEQFIGDAEGLVRRGIEQVLGAMPSGERDRHLIREAMQALKTVKSG